MNSAARLLGLAVTAFAGSAPMLALAQAADPPAAGPHGYGWIWLLAAAIVIVALFKLFSSNTRRPPPSRPTAP